VRVAAVWRLSQAPVEWVRDPSGSATMARPSVLPGEVDTPEYIILILSAGGSTRVEIEGTHPRGQLIRSDSEFEVNPFHPWVRIAAEGPPVRVHISHPEQWAVRTFDETGTLTRVVALAAPREPIAQDAARDLDARFAIPDSLPAIRSIVADAEGHLWLEERSDGHGRGSGYQILDPSGRWLGRVERPEALTAVFEIGTDYVLALEGDEWGVQRVKMYRLIREP
jgi:hypothetical protein